MLGYLGYERADYSHEEEWPFEDWKRWLEGTPHEITIIEQREGTKHAHHRSAVGHHNHIALCASDRDDVDKLHQQVLAPLEEEGICVVEDPPCDCPEYAEGYYATFFFDPDGLKYEFVHTPG